MLVPVLVVTLVTAAGSWQAASAQVTERARQDTLQLLLDARALFNDAKLNEAIEAFGRVIGQSRDARSDREMRLLLARAYAYRAQAFLVLGDEARAREDLTALVATDAEFRLDVREAPTQLREMHTGIIDSTVGIIVLDVPKTTTVDVDDVRLPSGVREHRIVQGTHRLVLVEPGVAPQVTNVVVRPGNKHLVRLSPRDPETEEEIGNPPPPSRERLRRVLLHLSAPTVLYTSSSSPSGTFTQSIYNRVGQFDVAQSPRIEIGAQEWGAAFVVSSGFAVGLTYSKSFRPYDGDLSGLVPTPGSFLWRPVSDVDADTRDIERAYHLEIRGQISRRRFETALWIGPTFAELERDYVRLVSVEEQGGGAFVVRPVQRQETERQMGWNMGLDVGWFPIRYVGVGFGMRYVASKYRGTSGAGVVDVPASHTFLTTIGLRTRF